jgi:hypothetical protein
LEGKENFWQTSGASSREIAKPCLRPSKLCLRPSLRGAVATKQSILLYDIAMPRDGLLRCARNDDYFGAV